MCLEQPNIGPEQWTLEPITRGVRAHFEAQDISEFLPPLKACLILHSARFALAPVKRVKCPPRPGPRMYDVAVPRTLRSRYDTRNCIQDSFDMVPFA